jgi:RNA polymerase primary sigma factor
LEEDPVTIYLREACAFPPLTRDEEIELSRHVLARDEQAESAGRRLVEANLAAVVTIAEGYPKATMHVLDMIQKGNAGLLRALETFQDSSKSFSAHAADCISEAIAKG